VVRWLFSAAGSTDERTTQSKYDVQANKNTEGRCKHNRGGDGLKAFPL